VQKAVVYFKKSAQLLYFVILYSLSQAYILLKETGRKKGQVNDSVTWSTWIRRNAEDYFGLTRNSAQN